MFFFSPFFSPPRPLGALRVMVPGWTLVETVFPLSFLETWVNQWPVFLPFSPFFSFFELE